MEPEQRSNHDRHPPPRKAFHENLFHTLPPYTGPYPVGYLELELPARQPRTFSHIRRDHTHLLRMDTVLFSIFYPAERHHEPKHSASRRQRSSSSSASAQESASQRDKKNADERPLPSSRVPWLPRPRAQTCKGYAKFLNIPHLPVTAYIAATSMFTKLPALRNAPIATPIAEEDSHKGRGRGSQGQVAGDEMEQEGRDAAREASASHQENQDGTNRKEEDEKANELKEDLPFPCIIFSHGLGGSRTYSSSICGELASFGFIVISMEHRDGSGARSYVNMPAGAEEASSAQNRDKPSKERTIRHSTPQTPDEHDGTPAASSYMVDYIFPKDNAQDTSPNNARGVDTELRTAQVEMRLAEIEEAHHVLSLMNAGGGPDVAARNLRRKGNVGSSSRGTDGIDWTQWKSRIGLDSVTMMGHSFGGATSVQALRLGKRFPWIGQGVILDAWGPATPESSSRVTKPLLSVGSEAFMHWQENFDKVQEICSEAASEGAPCWMLTIRGSTHLSQTDFAVLYPRWMALLMKTIVNPERALRLTVTTTLEFLRVSIPRGKVVKQLGWNHEGLLERTDSLPEVSVEYRPSDKWIGARLKIPNEFSLRMSTWFRRKWRRKVDKDGIPKDESGKPLPGLIHWEEGSEIWMHLTPDQPASEPSRQSTVPAGAI